MTIRNSEDLKLLTLATSSMKRNGAEQSAALRDGTGRTHVGNSVALASLALDALQVALSMAISSGAASIEAAVIVGRKPSAQAMENIREFSPNSVMWFANEDGSSQAL